MIVPATRLLIWVAALVVPLTTLLGIFPRSLPLTGPLLLVVLLVVLIDAARAIGRLDGITLSVPAVNRLTRDRSGDILLTISSSEARPRRLRVGLPLPEICEDETEELQLQVGAESGDATVSWTCRPLRRGRYPLTVGCLGSWSPLGLWEVHRRQPLAGELRIYPNLAHERRTLAPFFLNRGFAGLHALRQVGRGREFEKLREYSPGDSYEDVHWKATARRGQPITKVYQVERTQEVYVLVDASRLSARPAPLPGDEDDDPRRHTVLERFVTAALIMGLAAEKQGDLFGLLTFSNKVDRFLRAKNGKAHYGSCRESLYTVMPRDVTPDFEELCSYVRLRLRRRALLIILTSLDDPLMAEEFQQAVQLLNQQHLVIVNMIQPPGVQPLFSDQQVETVDDIYHRLGGHLRWHDLAELRRDLQTMGVPFHVLDNEALCHELVSQYINVKQRQAL